MAEVVTVGLSEVQSRPVVTREDVNKRVVLAYPSAGRWVGKLLDVFDHPNQAGQTVHRVLIGNRAENFVNFAPRPLNDGEEFITPSITGEDLTESMTNSGAFVAAKTLKAKKAGTPSEPKPAKETVTRYCASGSGKVTRGGAFAPGGDAQLKSLLLKVERGQAQLSEIADISREYILSTPHWAERWAHIFEAGFTPAPVAKKTKAARPVAVVTSDGAVVETAVEEAAPDEEFVEEEDIQDEYEDADDEDLDDDEDSDEDDE